MPSMAAVAATVVATAKTASQWAVEEGKDALPSLHAAGWVLAGPVANVAQGRSLSVGSIGPPISNMVFKTVAHTP